MNPDDTSPESPQYYTFDVYEACRLLWHKTRRRALNELRSTSLRMDLIGCYAAMCNQPHPFESREPCDWRIASASVEHFRAMIIEENTIYLSVLVGEVMAKSPALEKEFFRACAPLGRDVRCRDLVLSATRFYQSWKKSPSDELTACPFPPEIEAQADALFPLVMKFLLDWSLPRMDAIETAFRARILPDKDLANLNVETYIEKVKTAIKLMPRHGPPLPQLLPAVACLRIQRELEKYAQNLALCGKNQEQREAYGHVLAEALHEILHHYHDILRAHDLTERCVMMDIYFHDMPKGPEKILGKYASFARTRKQ